MIPQIVEGDLLEQDVEVIVNSWNMNLLPWWLLFPQGVSRVIRKYAGSAPFRELAKFGIIPLGGVVVTSAGRLKYKSIIHVAGINFFWIASEKSIRNSVRNAMAVADQSGYKSIAFPVIGSGTGGIKPREALNAMLREFQNLSYPIEVKVVVHKRSIKNTYLTVAVIEDYEKSDPEPLRAMKGEVVTIHRRETDPDWAGWHYCTHSSGKNGWISESYLLLNGNQGTLLRDYDARELTVKQGDILELLQEDHGWYWCRNSHNHEGWVPKQNIKW